mmetsp:Transcript_32261/g.56636  ORF Transcript_32261/g.56636 Transcript_32261/m.56636 type:complete len:155 (+) Transcript_32261:54-518(+)
MFCYYSSKTINEINEYISKFSKEKANKFLQKAAEECTKIGYKPTILKLVQGEPIVCNIRRALQDYIDEVKPEMLICGSRGAGALGKVYLGSVSDHLMRNCKCTVMVVKSAPHASNNAVERAMIGQSSSSAPMMTVEASEKLEITNVPLGASSTP